MKEEKVDSIAYWTVFGFAVLFALVVLGLASWAFIEVIQWITSK